MISLNICIGKLAPELWLKILFTYLFIFREREREGEREGEKRQWERETRSLAHAPTREGTRSQGVCPDQESTRDLSL